MNATTVVILALAGGFALANWVSRVNGSRVLEWCTKPTVTALLALGAVTLDARDGAARAWFVAALVLSLAGDVFLMLPDEQFVPGLASFLLAHVAYVVGFVAGGLHGGALAVAVVPVVVVLGPIGVTIVRAAHRTHPADAPPVAIYVVVIATMVVCAGGSHRVAAIVGASLFALSDATIAFTRFVRVSSDPREARWFSLFIMVTYHLGQAGLVLSLVK